ncbi:LOW QUALITY PROTEIN: hypothetical protein MAR_025505 [Mya arenaria]|uniref:Integrase zinc-binding domain-containing protein n=1 Tax=Mya arenaria TaxID=6604 RepID=A0ABY7ENA7_MYAAR|nr:LOW QUALITY PROTEIN: hypothetical protein MAR_025505 [Mya arenaria]
MYDCVDVVPECDDEQDLMKINFGVFEIGSEAGDETDNERPVSVRLKRGRKVNKPPPATRLLEQNSLLSKQTIRESQEQDRSEKPAWFDISNKSVGVLDREMGLTISARWNCVYKMGIAWKVLWYFHDAQVSGHLKVKRTMNCARLCSFFWMGMRNTVQEYVNSDWDLYLDYVVLAYNSSVHDSTGYSPHYTVYGTEMLLPIAILNGDAQFGVQRDDNTTLPTFVSELKVIFKEIHALVRPNLSKSSERQKKQYDCRVKLYKYIVGDIVLLKEKSSWGEKNLSVIGQGHELFVRSYVMYFTKYVILRHLHLATTPQSVQQPNLQEFVTSSSYCLNSDDVPNYMDNKGDSAGQSELSNELSDEYETSWNEALSNRFNKSSATKSS